MNKNLKKIVVIFFIIGIISIPIICILRSNYPKPKSEQELFIGDKICGYRNMNRWNTFSCLTSIKQDNYSDEQIYEIKFIQYYDNNSYEFVYYLKKDDYITLFYDKKPTNKIRLKITVDYDNKSIILINEELLRIEKEKETKKKKSNG